MSANLTYALHSSGRMIHILDAKMGLECDCVCPNEKCASRLVAKNNPEKFKNAKHFAHYQSDECGAALESMLHKRAKQIICDNNKLNLAEGIIYNYQKAIPEKSIEQYRADVELNGTDGSLVIEIVVTCDVTDLKKAYLNKSGKRLLVIDLQDINRNIDDDLLTEILIEDIDLKDLILPTLPRTATPSTDTGFSIQEKLIGLGAVVVIALLFFPKTIKKIFGSGTKPKRKR